MSNYNTNTSAVTQEEFNYAQEVIKKLSAYYDEKVVGQQNLKFALVASIIADGHILIESVPVEKTAIFFFIYIAPINISNIFSLDITLYLC